MKCRITIQKPSGINSVIKKELHRQAKEWGELYNIDLYSNFLFTLYDEFDFDKKQLKKAFDAFVRNYDKFTKEYGFEDTYAERYKLKQIGVDVEHWIRESGILRKAMK